MLTSLPPALLHRVRDAARYVHDLAELGLALLCPCDDDHGAGARWLTGDGTGEALPPLPDDAYPPGAVELPVAGLPTERLAGLVRLGGVA